MILIVTPVRNRQPHLKSLTAVLLQSKIFYNKTGHRDRAVVSYVHFDSFFMLWDNIG